MLADPTNAHRWAFCRRSQFGASAIDARCGQYPSSAALLISLPTVPASRFTDADTRCSRPVRRPVQQVEVLRGDKDAVATDHELDPHGDRAGVGIQFGKDERRHVEGHAVDQNRGNDCVVPAPAQGAFASAARVVASNASHRRQDGRLCVCSCLPALLCSPA